MSRKSLNQKLRMYIINDSELDIQEKSIVPITFLFLPLIRDIVLDSEGNCTHEY